MPILRKEFDKLRDSIEIQTSVLFAVMISL